MSVEEIEAALGPPNLKFNGAGGKTTYNYKDLGVKVIFTNGKVTDIQ